MYEVYITKVVDGVGGYTDTYMRRELGKIFDEAGVHVFTVKKTSMAWGVDNRQWHEAFEVLYCVKEEDLEKITVIVYLINKAFSGAKAVYSIRKVKSGVKAFYMGAHVEKVENEDKVVAGEVNWDSVTEEIIKQVNEGNLKV